MISAAKTKLKQDWRKISTEEINGFMILTNSLLFEPHYLNYEYAFINDFVTAICNAKKIIEFD